MLPSNRIPTHPGEVLLEEFLKPLGLSQARLAAHIGVSARRIGELVRGRRPMTPDLAWQLSMALGTTPEFWLNLQSQRDLAASRPTRQLTRLAPAS